MKRLYTLALSALVLAASATVAVPTMKMARTAKTAQVERLASAQPRARKAAAKHAPATVQNRMKTAVKAWHGANIENLQLKPQAFQKKTATAAKKIEIQAKQNISKLPASPMKIKAKAPGAAPADAEALSKMTLDVSYYDIYSETKVSGDATFKYYPADDQYDEELYIQLPGAPIDLYITYADGKITIPPYAGYGNNIYLSVVDSSGALTWKSVEAPYNPTTGAFEFPTDFVWALGYLDESTGQYDSIVWLGTLFELSIPDGDYKISLNLENQCTPDNKFTITATTGADVVTTKAIVIPQDCPGSYFASSINDYGMEVTSGQNYTFDPANDNNFSEPMTESGIATIIYGTFDANGELKKTAEAHVIVIVDDENGWKNVGEIDYIDLLFSQNYQNVSHNQKAMLQAREDHPGLYRIVDPYSNFIYSHSSTCGSHNLIIDVSDPEWVEVPFCSTGVNMGYGIACYGTIAALGYDKDSGAALIEASTLVGQTVTFPTKSLFIHETEYNAPNSWSRFNISAPVTFTFPDVNLNMTVVDTENQPVEGATVVLGEETATTDAEGKATVKAPFENGYFATVKPTVNGKEFEINLNGAETAYTATIEVTEPEPAKAQVVDFDFVTKQYGIDKNRGVNSNDEFFKTATIDSLGVHIEFNYEGSGSGMRFWTDGLRIHKNGTVTIKISAPGHVISAVDFVSAAAFGTYTVNGEPSTEDAPKLKTGSNIMKGENLETMTIAVTSTDNKALKSLKVVLDGTAGEFPKEVVEFTDIAAFLAAQNANVTSVITGDVTVTYQNGKYLFVTDATGSLEVYGDVNKTYANGTVLKNISGTYGDKNKMPQLVPEAASFTEGTQGAAVAPVEYDAANVHVGQYVVMTDSTITADGNKFYAGGVQLYDQFKNIEGLEIKEAEKATITGIYGQYNSTYEIFVTDIKYDGEGGGEEPDPEDPDPVDPTPGEDLYTVADVVGDYEIFYLDELYGLPYQNEMTVAAGEGENILVFNVPFILDQEYIWSLVGKLDPKTGNITFTESEQPALFEGAAADFMRYDMTAGDNVDVTEIVANYDGTTVVFDEDDMMSLGDDEDYYTLFDAIEMSKAVPVANPNEGWKNIGKAHLMDGWVLPGFYIDQAENVYEVEMQQSETNANLYRLVDPYHGDCPVAEDNDCDKVGYIEFNVTDPNNVIFSNVKAGFGNILSGFVNIYCYDAMSLFCNLYEMTPAEINEMLTENNEEPIVGSTYKDGVITVNEACYGITSKLEYSGFVWEDDEENPANMAAKIWFPGVTPEVGGGEDDSIREISAADGQTVIYNLHGQRVNKATRGIYIINNQKLLVK